MPERDAGDPVAFLADLHQWSKATLAGRTARSAPQTVGDLQIRFPLTTISHQL
jgi:hypothetical protein